MNSQHSFSIPLSQEKEILILNFHSTYHRQRCFLILLLFGDLYLSNGNILVLK